jgi:hypothetical protein
MCANSTCQPFTLVANQSNGIALALDSSHVFWATHATAGTVQQADKDGTNVIALGSSQAHTTAVDVAGGFVY